MNSIGIGIIGFGRIGAEHSGWISQTGLARVADVFDPTPARRDLAKSRGFATVDSLEILLADPSVDAVLISTPTAMHFDQAMTAIRAGKHLMIEKPMALDLPQSERIVRELHTHKLVGSVFHCRRWDADYLTVRSAVESGVLGKIINIESRLGQWGSCVGPAAREYRPNWRNEANFGGGGLFDWGSHFIDQLWQLMSPAKPVRVFAQLRGNIWTQECDDFARVCVDFDNGSVGLMEINTTTTRPLPRWHLDGTLGSAESPFSLEFDTKKWANLEFTPANGQPSRLLPLISTGLSEIAIWQSFAQAIVGLEPPAVRIESVLPTMRLLDAARLSSQTGQAVGVNLGV